MIIDRESFTDIATHLERASCGVLAAACGLSKVCPTGASANDPAMLSWLKLVEALVAVNAEITALEGILRGLLEANCEEEQRTQRRKAGPAKPS
jgi:hypothetical protein